MRLSLLCMILINFVSDAGPGLDPFDADVLNHCLLKRIRQYDILEILIQTDTNLLVPKTVNLFHQMVEYRTPLIYCKLENLVVSLSIATTFSDGFKKVLYLALRKIVSERIPLVSILTMYEVQDKGQKRASDTSIENIV